MSAAVRPQDLVEQALGFATLPCVLWVTEHAEANLRWANNALITNGEMRSRSLTVTAMGGVAGGTAAGTVIQEIAGADDVAAVVAAAEHLARTGRPGEDASPMVENYSHHDVWAEPPESTSIDILGELAKGLGVAFESAHAARQLLFGFAEHGVATTTGQQHRFAAPRRAANRQAGTQRQDGRSRILGMVGTDDPRLLRY